MSGCVWRISLNPPRTSAWSTDRVASVPARAGVQLAAEQVDPFPHPGQPVTGLVGGGGWGLAIIGDVKSESVGVVVDDNARPRRSGVFEGVRERLLDDAVGGQVEAGGQRPRPALHPDLDFDAGVLHGLGEGRKIVQSRLRGQRWRVVVAQNAKEAA
jgi:hypothetical protein